jgi:hypothetical protein
VINHDNRTIKERLLSKVAARGMPTSLLMDELHQEGFRQAFFEHQDLRRSGEIMEIEYTIDGVRHALTLPKGAKVVVHGRYGTWTPPADDCVKEPSVIVSGQNRDYELVQDIPEAAKPYHGMTPPRNGTTQR